MRVCILFGGPSDERNISAGSIKPWVTWLAADPRVEVEVVFLDRERGAWLLSERWWYANTCEDFEGELGPDDSLDDDALAALLRSADLAVPLVHGEMGEDGELQERLEALGVEYLFSRPAALAASLDKARCYRELAAIGLPVPAHFAVSAERWRAESELVRARARGLCPEAGGARPGPLCAVKPLAAGSSLGVTLARGDGSDFDQAMQRALALGGTALVEEPVAGTEFSCVVLETLDDRPVALAPTEVEPRLGVYDTRSKYLQGEAARLHTPFRQEQAIEPIRRAAERAFRALGLRDMARIDGFVREGPGRRPEVLVTDVNGISGISFSSFVFLQTALVGLDHAGLLRLLLGRGLARAGRETPPDLLQPARPDGERVHVLFGGATSERQVSRQSGIFVGLCLASRGHDVRFVLARTDGRYTPVGTFLALHHDVEEIEALVDDRERRSRAVRIARAIGTELGLPDPTRHLGVGATTGLAEAVRSADFCFLALHGGEGEDGRIQAALDLLGVPYNGAGAASSRLCADKWMAVELVRATFADDPSISAPRHRRVSHAELCEWVADDALEAGAPEARFRALCRELEAAALVVKPRADGCSTGVKLVRSGSELQAYLRAVATLAGEFRGPSGRAVKLPRPAPAEWVVEQALVEPDPPPLPAGDWNSRTLRPWFERKRWIELTCAVLERPRGGLRVAVPSITVAAESELSLEEKFQQGTGTNLALSAFCDRATTDSVRARAGRIAAALGVRGYARLDLFWDRQRDVVLLLEPNTLCGLTEATVFYTQMLAATRLAPAAVLDEIVRLGLQRAGVLRPPAGREPASSQATARAAPRDAAAPGT